MWFGLLVDANYSGQEIDVVAMWSLKHVVLSPWRVMFEVPWQTTLTSSREFDHGYPGMGPYSSGFAASRKHLLPSSQSQPSVPGRWADSASLECIHPGRRNGWGPGVGDPNDRPQALGWVEAASSH